MSDISRCLISISRFIHFRLELTIPKLCFAL
jgi:hypothetical protein